MKTIVLSIAALLITGIASAQYYTQKRFSTGFNLGMNHANAILDDNSNGGVVQNGIGFRLGLISDFAYTKRFSIQPKAEISFNKIKFRDESQELNVSPVNIEFSSHFKIRVKPCPSSVYFLFGPNVRIPIGSEATTTLPTRKDVALDLGIGYDLGFGNIRISPELRYSIGLLNITRATNVRDLKFHNISLLLNFSGRPRL